MKFVCWLWNGRGFWKDVAKYNEGHALTLRTMLERHGGHELICVHSDAFSPPGASIRMPAEVAALPNYLPKLWAWSPQFADLMGERFVSIDLDVVVTGDLAPVLQSNAPLRIWNQAAGEPYNTSLFALEPGYGHEVWTEMSLGAVTQAVAQRQRWTGDQSWVAHVLGPNEETFGEETGVIQYRRIYHAKEQPSGMKAAFLCGPYEPISESEISPWIKRAYQ